MDNIMPAFLCGRSEPLTKAEYIDLSDKLTKAHAKWKILREKYPGKTTREIIELERKSAQ